MSRHIPVLLALALIAPLATQLRAQDELKLRGRIEYATWAKCLLDSRDMAALGQC